MSNRCMFVRQRLQTLSPVRYRLHNILLVTQRRSPRRWISVRESINDKDAETVGRVARSPGKLEEAKFRLLQHPEHDATNVKGLLGRHLNKARGSQLPTLNSPYSRQGIAWWILWGNSWRGNEGLSVSVGCWKNHVKRIETRACQILLSRSC